MTPDDGNAEFDLVHFTAVSTGQFVTATATDPEGNTSEFSACIVVTRPPEKPPQERGTIVTVAGTGAGKWIDGKRVSYSGDGGPAVNASMSVSGLFVDRHGQIFIADRESHRIRKVDADGIVTTVAGNGEAGSAGDGGPATQAQLESPSDVFVDHGGNLFITDGRANRVRKVDSNGIISTIAGTGDRGFSGDGGPAVQAALAGPGGVFPVASGHIYVADGGNARVRRIDPDGTIRTIAGTGSRGFSGDGGPALQAELTGMHALFVVRSGDVYFIDVSNSRVRKIDADGIITTVAGNGEHAESTRSAPDGQRITELPLAPGGLFVDGGGNMFITDRSRNRVYRIDADGVITTVAGNADRDVSGDGGPAVEAGLGFLLGKIFVDGAGDLYIAGSNRVRRVAGVAVPTTLDAVTTTAVVETGSPVQPRSPRLEQNAPNPFNSQTVIRFSLARQTELELTVYNLAGQKVVTLLKQRRAAGDHVVVWNGRDDEGVELGTGVYLYRLRTESQVATRKLLLLH